jgi:lipopolysaccharide biosynthesis glycosyltransferase
MSGPREVLKEIANRVIPSRRTSLALSAVKQIANEKYSELHKELHETQLENSRLKNEASIDARLYELTAAGKSLDQITHTLISSELSGLDAAKLHSFAQNLIENPATADSGWLAKARLLAIRNFHDSALKIFKQVGYEESIKVAPLEFLATTLRLDEKIAFEKIEQLAAGASNEHLLELCKIAAGVKNVQALKILISKIQRSSLSENDQSILDRMQDFLNFEGLAFDAKVHFAVFDYKTIELENSSKNIGDYTQSIAALSHLTRFSNINFVGDEELVQVVQQVQDRHETSNLLSGNPVTVSIQTAHRDNSNWEKFHPNTWIISNGWFMHTPFAGEADFPFNPNLNPIFISFNITDSAILTDEAVEYLKAHSPIGCRDWRTTYLLRSRGISAFFSGCLTTTVGQVFSKTKTPKPKTVIQVDAHKSQIPPKGFKVSLAKQELESVREISFTEGIKSAFSLLESYADYELIQTSRLHSYLPSRSIGYQVELRPNYLADPRFDGLMNLSDSAFADMRANLSGKMEAILKFVLTGATKAEVYAAWNELCQPDLAATEAKLKTPTVLPSTSIDVAAAVKQVNASRESFGEVAESNSHLQLGFALDQNLVKYLPTVLKSIESNTEATADVHVFCRGFNSDLLKQMSTKFQKFNFHFYSFDSVDYGKKVKTLKHITVSTMDRLLVPELLSDLDKLIYLDTDILVRADLAELNALDFGDCVLIGKASTSDLWSDLTKITLQASKKMSFEMAANFNREMLINNDVFNTTPVNAGVIVMNLAAMRNDSFSEKYLYLVEHCSLNDQDVLNIYAGNRIRHLPIEWNFIPSQDVADSPKIVHWAGPAKPWNSARVIYQDEFLKYLEWAESNFNF